MSHITPLIPLCLFTLSLASTGLPAAAADSLDFGEQIYPILRDNCLSCHAAPYEDTRGRIKNPKGDVRLDTPEWIQTGYINDDGVTVAIVHPGDAAASTLYTRTILPEDHDDIMPAKGDPLSPEQTEQLKQWINTGAHYGTFEAPTYINPKSAAAQ